MSVCCKQQAVAALVELKPCRHRAIELYSMSALAAGYDFSCTDRDFLELNFHPVIFELMPWSYMSQKTGLSSDLVDLISRNRAAGVAISSTVAQRNEATAKL